MRALQRQYTFSGDRQVVVEFLEEEPVLFSLLTEALEPLRAAFGKGRLLHARVQRSDEDTLLKVAVQLPADFDGDATACRRCARFRLRDSGCRLIGASFSWLRMSYGMTLGKAFKE
jgi:hypothetical protein